jgi:short-subunit dehydrogenase
MRIKSFTGVRALVTGASSGIGRALALELGRRGSRLLLTGRSLERLEDVAQRAGSAAGAVESIAADLTSAADRDRVLRRASDLFGGSLDLAIHAAGIGAYGRFETHDPHVLRHLLELNFVAVAELCRLELPLLRRGNAPAIVQIGSIVARRGLPGRPEYSASKHALAGFTDAIRAEWRRDGIQVLLVNPGFCATEFERNAMVDTAIYRTEPRRSMRPEAVANATLRAVARGRNEITLTSSGRLLLSANRIAPRWVDWGFGRWAARLYSSLKP